MLPSEAADAAGVTRNGNFGSTSGISAWTSWSSSPGRQRAALLDRVADLLPVGSRYREWRRRWGEAMRARRAHAPAHDVAFTPRGRVGCPGALRKRARALYSPRKTGLSSDRGRDRAGTAQR